MQHPAAAPRRLQHMRVERRQLFAVRDADEAGAVALQAGVQLVLRGGVQGCTSSG